MAHSCPDCGSTCYCGSDIDDCLLDDEEDVNACTHCPIQDDDTYEPDDESWEGGFADNH